MGNKNVMQRLGEYLKEEISPEDVALDLRRVKLELVKLILSSDTELINMKWVSDGLYTIDRLSEILDPYFDKK